MDGNDIFWYWYHLMMYVKYFQFMKLYHILQGAVTVQKAVKSVWDNIKEFQHN